MKNVSDKIQNGINDRSKIALNRVTEELVRDAIQLMKAKKSDAIFNITSDFYIHAPKELTYHLTNLIRMFLSHGKVPSFVLMCTLLPLVKDKLGDVTSSSNYRAIAGGCLLLKLIDLVILRLEGDKLSFNVMQFAYQSKANITMCTWTVTSVVDHFISRGTTVYGAAMDIGHVQSI